MSRTKSGRTREKKKVYTRSYGRNRRLHGRKGQKRSKWYDKRIEANKEGKKPRIGTGASKK